MSRTLVVKPSGRSEKDNRPWVLVFRSHDLGGTDYEPIVYLTDDQASELVECHTIAWLYEPDWEERARKRELERARVLREEAEAIESANKRAV